MILVLCLSVGLGILLSCEKEYISSLGQEKTTRGKLPQDLQVDYPTIELCGTVTVKKLLTTNQTIIGKAYFFNDRKYLYVQAVANNNFKFYNTYLYAGMKDEVPMTPEGDPDITSFNYKIVGQGLSQVRNFKIPLSSLSGTFALGLVLIVKTKMWQPIHVDIKAWAEGYSIGANEENKGMLFAYKKGICLYLKPEAKQDPLE